MRNRRRAPCARTRRCWGPRPHAACAFASLPGRDVRAQGRSRWPVSGGVGIDGRVLRPSARSSDRAQRHRVARPDAGRGHARRRPDRAGTRPTAQQRAPLRLARCQARLGGVAPGHRAGRAPRAGLLVARPRFAAASRGAVAGGDRADRAAPDRHAAIAPRVRRAADARQRHGPGHTRQLRRPVAPRGRPVDARAPRVRDGADRDRPDDSERVAALGARAQDQVLEAMGRLLRGNTRAMDASCRLQVRRFRRAAVGRGAGHRAFAHGRLAPPMRHADRGARRRGTRLHACRWAWPASRTPRTRRRT